MPTSSQKSVTVNYTYKPNTGIVTGVSSTVTGIDGKKQTISNTYNYTGDRLTSITHNGFNYGFTYDSFGNRLSTKVGSQTLMTDTYGANNGLLTKSTYGNGNYVENIYDRYDRVTGIKYNGVQKFGYEYNADGLVSRHTDSINGKTYNYTYDLLGRLQKTEISDGSSIGYKFDKVNNVTNTLYKFNGVTKTTQYPAYFKGGVIKNVTYPNGATKTRSLNAHAQVGSSTLKTTADKEWKINRQYYTPTINGVTYTTNVMGNLIYENIDRTFSYAYNGSGNISKITDKTGTTAKESTFVYDEANQLIRENNAYTNKTVTYTYDAGGNILTKTEYPFTTGSLDGLTGTVVNYTYGNTNWKDLLTEFNGQPITYDQIGNPLSYYNGTTFTWERGRKLATATTADGTAISYKYNDSGIRTQKTVGGVATDYFLDGSKIIAEKTNGNTTWYYYDGDGTREAIEYGGNVYYYFYNAQGDVVGLFDNNLNVVVEYTYDSWGNVLSITGSLASTLGQDNPFRYRGYYFDSDTGLYYLNSRYYDANTGRFINADGELSGEPSIQGYNLFAYGFNNPVNLSDEDGNWPKWAKKLVAAVAVVAVVAVVAAVTVATAGAGTAAACFAIGAAKGAAIGFAVGAASGVTTSVIKNRVKTGSWKGSGKAALEGGADGALTGAITGAITGGLNSNVCFVAGTAVLTSVGHVAIEEIRAGDKVWSENPETGEKELKKVVQTFVNETDELVHVFVSGEEIITTPEHPFYVPTKGWIGAIHLRAGDILVLQNGKYVVVEKIQHEILEQPIKVYNFEVEDFHTYYVGDSSVLVHNVCGAKNTPDQDAVIKLAKEFKTGISRTDANTLVGWAKEYGLNYHYPTIHVGRSGICGKVEHIKVFVHHIPIVK